MSNVFSVEQLISMNEMMLGRGMPTQDDGIGYNKADYGACSNYFFGLSDAQVADLAKRLVKYSETQLNIDRELMKSTANHYTSLVGDIYTRSEGVSISVEESDTLIGFRFNRIFIEAIKQQPQRQFDADSKQWIVPNGLVIRTLKALQAVGADVDNALRYAENHPLIHDIKTPKTDVVMKVNEGDVFIKFRYNKDIVDEIKKIKSSDRSWNPQHKYWAIKRSEIKALMQNISDIATFKTV